MFSENHRKSGCIEVVCGSMFSGKTEELIRRLRRAQFARQEIAIFKPVIDKRYSDVEVVSHDAHKLTATCHPQHRIPLLRPSSMRYTVIRNYPTSSANLHTGPHYST